MTEKVGYGPKYLNKSNTPPIMIEQMCEFVRNVTDYNKYVIIIDPTIASKEDTQNYDLVEYQQEY